MQKNKVHSTLLFSFILCFITHLHSQNIQDKVPLIKVLTMLEQKFEIQFNYAVSNLENVLVELPDTSRLLDATISNLESQTNFTFHSASKSIYYITAPSASKVCGYIIDAYTNKPLEGATCVIGTTFTTSDIDGYFEFEKYSDIKKVSITYLGYEEVTYPSNKFTKNGCGNYYLAPKNETLKTIALQAYLVQGIDKIANGAIQIDYPSFEILPGLIENDVLQTIQALPGISSVDETVSNLNIRGGSNDQNLILWDDIKMYQTGHFFGLISNFNPQITNTATIINNGSDTEITDGVSGTIAMQTDPNVSKNFKGNVGANFLSADAFADIPLYEGGSIQIAGRRSINDVLNTPTYNSFFDRIAQNTEVATNIEGITNTNRDFNFYDGSLRGLFKILEKDKVRVNFFNSRNLLTFDENAEINDTTTTRQSNVLQRTIATGLHYKRNWNTNLQTEAQGYYTNYRLQSLNEDILAQRSFFQENLVSEFSGKLKASVTISDKTSITTGYHFVQTEISNLNEVDNPSVRIFNTDVVETHGIFSQVNYTSLNANTTLSAGVRYNYIVPFKVSFLEPRFRFSQQVLKHFTLKIQGEFKNQTTSQIVNFQNEFLGIEKRRWQLANNEDIPILKSKQIATGLTFNNNKWLIDVDGYYKKVDGITTQSQEFQIKYNFTTEKGSYDVYGIDFLLRKKLGKFTNWMSYSFMDNTYTFNALPEQRFPSNFDITHLFTVGTTFKEGGLKLGMSFNYRTGRPTTNLENSFVLINQLNFGPANSTRLPSYSRIDFSGIYSFNITKGLKADIGASIWNVLAEENIISNFYSINNDMQPQEIRQQSLGTTANAMIRVYF